MVIMLFCKCTFKVWWIAKLLGMPQVSGVVSVVSQVTSLSDSSLLQSSEGEEVLERMYAMKHNAEFRACIHDGWISENSVFSVCLVLRKRRLTYLETTHVVDLGAEGQRGQYMDRREDDPEPDVIFSKHLEEKMEVVFTCGFPQRTSKISSLSNWHKESKTKCA